jgi:hypothetical protein
MITLADILFGFLSPSEAQAALILDLLIVGVPAHFVWYMKKGYRTA